jgi:hypothetical protein
MNTGNKGIINQIDCWCSIIVLKLRDPVSNIINNIPELKINSYEIIAAEDLIEPKNAYFELAAQPLKRTPYTPNEDNAKVYKIPSEKSKRVKPCPKGIIPHEIYSSRD